MGKIAAVWNVFRKGEAVADPALWKTGQITVTLLAPLLVALFTLARSFGYDPHLSNDDASALAGGIVVLVNLVGTVVTSRTVGIAPARTDATDVARVGEEPAPARTPAATRADLPRPSAPSVLDHSRSDSSDPFRDHGT